VKGKPPKKTSKASLWSKNSNQTTLIFDLRKEAFEACNNAKIKDSIKGKIKFSLTVFAPNILKRKDSEDYVGDIDALVAGVLDSIQPPPENDGFEIDPILEVKDKVGSDFPKIIEDDAQVVYVIAKKVKADIPSYTVVIEYEK